MGYEIQKEDMQALLRDKQLISEVVKRVTANDKVLSELANDVAEKLASAMEDDPMIKKQIIKAALASPGFKQKIVQQLVEQLGND